MVIGFFQSKEVKRTLCNLAALYFCCCLCIKWKSWTPTHTFRMCKSKDSKRGFSENACHSLWSIPSLLKIAYVIRLSSCSLVLKTASVESLDSRLICRLSLTRKLLYYVTICDDIRTFSYGTLKIILALVAATKQLWQDTFTMAGQRLFAHVQWRQSAGASPCRIPLPVWVLGRKLTEWACEHFFASVPLDHRNSLRPFT